MAVNAGYDALIKVNTGTPDSPVWTAVAGQRGATLNMSLSTIDITSKDSNRWTELIAGIKEWSVEFDALVVADDAGYSALRNAFLNGETVQIQLITAEGDTYQGTGIITDFPHTFAYDDAQTYKVTVKGSGALTFTAHS